VFVRTVNGALGARHMNILKITAATLAITVLAATAAQADTFSTKADYDAANVTTNDETFGGISPAGVFVSVADPFSIGNVSITSAENSVSSSSFFFDTPVDTFFVDVFSSPATFTFDSAVSAAGFQVANGFNGGDVTADLFNGANGVGSFTFNTVDQTSFTSFFGFNGLGPVTSVVLTPDDGGFLLVSEIESGNAAAGVPEPATWSMMILGFLGVGALMRRRSGLAVA
jgi:endoglucanase Acf2